MDTLELTRSEAQIKVSTGTRTIADFIDDIKHERKSRRPELEKKEKLWMKYRECWISLTN